MIPRLQRFYGGNPERWHEIPVWLLVAYNAMLPRLQAEETLAQLGLMQAGGGRHTAEKDLKAYVRNLERQARGGWEPRARRLKSLSSLRSLGIQVVRTPKTQRAEGDDE